MKRIDKALKKCMDRIKKDIVQQQCPIQFLDGTRDEKTTKRNSKFIVIGCRGITCKKCWDKEVNL